MAYNYTVSEYIFTEAVTDANYAGNMISGGTMTITPNSGYVVSAANFSASGTLPAQFASISFTDTAVAGEINNTVTVTFTFAALFEMSPTLNNINLPITGHANLIDDKREIDFSLTLIDNTTENANGQTVLTGSYVTGSPATGLTSGTRVSGTIDANNNIVIATITLTADANNHFNEGATISIENAPTEASFTLQSIEVATTNSDGQRTSIKYGLKLNSSVGIPSGLGCKVFIHYTGVSDRATLTTSKKEIKEIIYGEPEISIKGATRRIKIVGDVDAEFDLTITKNSNNTSIMDTNLANADIIHNPAGLIRGLNKTLTESSTNQLFATYEFIQEFPSASSNEIYHINVTPKGSTILNANLTQAAPQGIIYQYINPTITIVAIKRSLPINSPANIVYTGRPNKKPSKLKHIKSIVETFQINYQLTHTSGAGNTVTAGTPPTWSSTDQTASSWTHSVTAENGGTHIEIVNIAVASGDPTATVTADVIVKKFGTADVTMVLDLTEFIST